MPTACGPAVLAQAERNYCRIGLISVEDEMVAKPDVVDAFVLLSPESLSTGHVIHEERNPLVFPEIGADLGEEPRQDASTESTIVGFIAALLVLGQRTIVNGGADAYRKKHGFG